MRIGLAEQSVLTALGHAAFLTPPSKGNITIVIWLNSLVPTVEHLSISTLLNTFCVFGLGRHLFPSKRAIYLKLCAGCYGQKWLLVVRLLIGSSIVQVSGLDVLLLWKILFFTLSISIQVYINYYYYYYGET